MGAPSALLSSASSHSPQPPCPHAGAQVLGCMSQFATRRAREAHRVLRQSWQPEAAPALFSRCHRQEAGGTALKPLLPCNGVCGHSELTPSPQLPPAIQEGAPVWGANRCARRRGAAPGGSPAFREPCFGAAGGGQQAGQPLPLAVSER